MSRALIFGYIVLAIIAASTLSDFRTVRADLQELDANLEEDRQRIEDIRDKYYPKASEPLAPFQIISEQDLDLMARVIRAEAGNQSMEGKRLVADVILNRADDPRFPDTIDEVLHADGQFTTVERGTIYMYEPDISDYGAALAELQERTNAEVLYFSNGSYQRTPVLKEGDHYFSR